MKIKKKNFFGGVGSGGRVGGGEVQGGCEWRSEAFVKIQKKKIHFFLRGGGGWGSGQGGGGLGWGGGGVRVDGNRELKLL